MGPANTLAKVQVGAVRFFSRLGGHTRTGASLVLMNSMFDTRLYPAEAFARLCYGCWRVEEAFKQVKYRLERELTSALSWHSVRQDFGSMCCVSTTLSVVTYVKLAQLEHLFTELRVMQYDESNRDVACMDLRVSTHDAFEAGGNAAVVMTGLETRSPHRRPLLGASRCSGLPCPLSFPMPRAGAAHTMPRVAPQVQVVAV